MSLSRAVTVGLVGLIAFIPACNRGGPDLAREARVATDETPPINEHGRNGFVPDANTAIKIAVAVWEPMFGAKTIAQEKPYRAKLLTNTEWRVEGSLPENRRGGVATAFIVRADGRILDVYHTK
jgi:hypothetical protein